MPRCILTPRRTRAASIGLAFVVLLAGAVPALARPRLASRIEHWTDAPPYDRATWAILVADSTGHVLYERNADRLMVPASNNKQLVSCAALGVLGPAYRVETSVYGTGAVVNGVLRGDLVVYGRGDPTFSEHCYDADSLASTDCDSMWTGIDALADQLVARGIRRVEGAIVGDGSCFEPKLTHDAWEQYDLNWWYAAPISGLGFNDNSVNIMWKPGPAIDAPARVSFAPAFDIFAFENRSRTTAAGTERTLDFFRHPGTMSVWAEGDVPVDDDGLTEYFAIPDPNLFFAQALRERLALKGVDVAGRTLSTTDSTRYADARLTPPLATRPSRPVSDLVFPILNTSQNGFAETLLKLLGREREGAGSWDAGLRVERRFLVDSVGVDSAAFASVDGSGLATNNLVSARALTQILRYVYRRPSDAAFVRALPRSGRPGSLHKRFIGTPLEGRVVAKTGSVDRVQSLAGYVERPRGGPLVFAVIVNHFAGPSKPVSALIDSVVVEAAKK